MEEKTIVTEAIRRGGLEAMRKHIAAGVPMVTQRDGSIAYLQPDELRTLLAEAEKTLGPWPPA